MNLLPLRPLMACALLLCLPAAAQTQDVYKTVGPDGKVTYTNKPDPKAKTPAKAKLAPAAIEGVEAYPGQGPQKSPAAPPDAKAADYREQVSAAKDKLENARKALADGAEPQEGERIHTLYGNKLNDKYFQRQDQLKKALEDAKAQYDALLAQ